MVTQDAKNWILVLASLAFFMDGLDGSIAMIALPTITADYGVSVDISTWVLISYLFIICAFILPMGKIIEQHGVKLIFILGFVIFAVTSLICAVAPTIWVLVAARFAQGFGACMLAAAAPALMALRLPTSIMGYAFGLIGAAAVVAFALGPVVGGILVEFFSWHWIFLINVPIGGVAALLAWRYIDPDPKNIPKTSIDYIGILFIAVTISILLLFVNGWAVYAPWISVALAALSVVMGYCTLRWEMSISDPIIPLALIYDRNVQKVLFALSAGYAIFTGFIFLLPFYMEIVRDMDPATIGLYCFLPALLAAIISPFAGKEMDMRGGRIVTSVGALIIVFVSFLMLASGKSGISFLFILSLITLGVAIGIFQGPACGRVIAVSPKEWHALASAFVSMSVYFGASLGTALFSGILSFYYDIASGSSVEFLWGWTAVCVVSIIVGTIALYSEYLVPDNTIHNYASEEV
ncbi:MAG: MFS transporter [Methanomicrobiales archaeon]|jgi:EmrB/QacA subfamily drug resistance transporter|nr:MFS transporter [Methanomicrobiales archaeon]